MKGYHENIDNLSPNVRDVRSIVVMPVFSHEDKEIDFANRKPLAIFQFINKADLKEVTEFDIKKIKELAQLLGTALHNVSEQHAAVNIIVSVHDRLFQLQQTQGALADNAKHHQPELEFTVEGRVLAENMEFVHNRLIESNIAQEE